jgi:hypothetical protein
MPHMRINETELLKLGSDQEVESLDAALDEMTKESVAEVRRNRLVAAPDDFPADN